MRPNNIIVNILNNQHWIFQVNRDIEIIINQRLKANERVAMLHHILIEHNELCLKVAEYNKFWAKYLMANYFFLIALICYSLFQAFFTHNLILARLLMFSYACGSAFIITRSSISAAVMSNLVSVCLRVFLFFSFLYLSLSSLLRLIILIFD